MPTRPAALRDEARAGTITVTGLELREPRANLEAAEKVLDT